MEVKFQADESLNHEVVMLLRRRAPGLDIRGAHEAGLRGLPDPEVLRAAALEGRVLVTADKATMPAHFAGFIADDESAGVIVVPRRLNAREAAEDIQLIWAATEAEEWVNRILYLPL